MKSYLSSRAPKFTYPGDFFGRFSENTNDDTNTSLSLMISVWVKPLIISHIIYSNNWFYSTKHEQPTTLRVHTCKSSI